MTRIVGIFLIRNEDVYVEQAVRNVVGFCDEILIADNYSTDRTWAVVQRLAQEYSQVSCARVRRTGDSHEMIQKYAGTRTWIFGVDGDELYDPEGLTRFREEVVGGRFDRWWVIFGNVLNCVSIDRERGEASGHLAPPCRSMTKLYNFEAITRWDGPCVERMLGGQPVFRSGFDSSLRLGLHEQVSWDDSRFRCLHTCFLRRSSRDRRDGNRPNPVELQSGGWLARLGLGSLRRRLTGAVESYKKEKYLRGELVRKDVSRFFRRLDSPAARRIDT